MAAKKRSNETLFNIAASGVINSGKSTLLNALLNKPVLGASNVPETINLTILKYSKDSFARVNFTAKMSFSTWRTKRKFTKQKRRYRHRRDKKLHLFKLKNSKSRKKRRAL
ncbi:dynamin family protein [Campylobacter concisus]